MGALFGSKSKKSSKLEDNSFYKQLVSKNNYERQPTPKKNYEEAFYLKCCAPCSDMDLERKERERNWEEFFVTSCKGLSKIYKWAEIIPKKLEKLEATDHRQYQIEFLEAFFNLEDKKKFNDSLCQEVLRMGSKTDIFGKKNHGKEEEDSLSSISNIFVISKQDTGKFNKSNTFNFGTSQEFAFPDYFKHYKNNSFLTSNIIYNMDSEDDDEEGDLPLTAHSIISKYKAVTLLLEHHLTINNHPLAFIKSHYEEYFNEKYSSLLKTEKFDADEFEYDYNLMINDLKEFIRIFKDSIYYYYCFAKVIKTRQDLQSVFSRENFINFLLGVLISDRVYNILFSARKILDHPKELILSNYLELRKGLDIKSFHICPKFTLDENTVLPNEEGCLESSENCRKTWDMATFKNAVASLDNFDKDDNSFHIVEEVEETAPKLSKLSTVKKTEPYPYSTAVDILKNIQYQKSPIHKLKVLIECAKAVDNCIDNFYKENSLPHCSLDSANKINIYKYIIVKAGVKSLFTQSNLIENFLTESQYSSFAGSEHLPLRSILLSIEREV